MPGPVALVGARAFLPALSDFDAGLLRSTGRTRPRVVILPTAGYPDGEEAFTRHAADGVAHFGALGAEVEPLLVRDRLGAADPGAVQAMGEADLVYLIGDRAGYLGRSITGTATGDALVDAHRRGAIVAACAGAAHAIGAIAFDYRLRVLPWPLRWPTGLGLAPDVAVITGYDARPEPLAALIALQAPRGSVVLGIDEGAAILGRDGAWQVHGSARVTVWRGRHRERHRPGDVFRT